MSGIIPSFLLRTWTLKRARIALTEGDCERALEYLAHPALSLSRRAERMRSKALGVLWRTAARKSRSGRTDSVARLIDLVAREDPESADDWSRRLLPTEKPDPTPTPSSGVRRLSTARTGSPHFHLAIDDVGEFLVACRSSLILGHSRGGRADLPFFADLESSHARLFLEESFHGGPRWHLEGLVPGAFEIVGAGTSEGHVALEHEMIVRLGANFEFQFLAPDPSSSSAVLKLLHGVECDGTAWVVLLAEGEAGRVRMGGRSSRHFVVPNLEEDVTLLLVGEHLQVRSKAELKARPAVEPSPNGGLQIPYPPTQGIEFIGPMTAQNRPPFSFTVLPGGAR